MPFTFRSGALVLLACLPLIAPSVAALPLPDVLPVPVPGLWYQWNENWGIAPGEGHGLALEVDENANNPYGYAGIALPDGFLLKDLTSLSFDSYFVNGGCGGGSPRFSLAIDKNGDGTVDGHVFVYAGPVPSFYGCATGTWTPNDLLDGAKRFDSTQLGGPFYGTLQDAVAAAGAQAQVKFATLVWDSQWLFGDHVSWYDNLQINCYHLRNPADAAASLLTAQSGVCVELPGTPL